jgi:hypothetical protein
LVRFGCFCQTEEMSGLADAGYEFAETDASVLYPRLDEAGFREARKAVLAEPLFAEVVRATGLLSETDGDEIELSFREAFWRAALVGAKVLVVGAPDTGRAERAEAWREAAQALGALGEQAARSGVTVAVAAGGRGSVAETLEEAWVLTEEVGHGAVGIAANLGMAGEVADIAAAGPAVRHVWLPLPRRYGGTAETTACLETLGDLVELGYSGRVSVEAEWSAIADVGGELLEELKAYSKGR